MSAVTIEYHSFDNNNFPSNIVHVHGRIDPEVYTTGGVDVINAINAALAAIRADFAVSALEHVVFGSSDVQSYLPTFVAATGLLRVDQLAGTNSVIPSAEWSDAIAANPAHTFTLPAGTIALAAEGTAGLTAPLFLQYTAAGATQEAAYDPAAGTIVTLAADTCTEIRALLLDPGSASVAAAFAQVPNLTDLTGVVEFEFHAVCSR